MKDGDELTEAWRDFLFEFGYSIGVVWVMGKMKCRKLKPWAQERLDNKKI